MRPRSMGMAVLAAAIVLLASGHPTSEAGTPGAPVLPKAPQPTAAAQPNAAENAGNTITSTPPGVTQHRVASGDTLFALAAHYNTKIDDIVRHNPGIDPDHLAVGQQLEVPLNTVRKQKSRDELAAAGSRMVLSSNGEPSDFKRKISGCVLTAYTNSFESTGKHPGDPGYGITASGQPAKEGWTIAVDPEVIPLHSIVYIPGVGVRYAEDTGGAVKGSHVDIFYNDDNYARHFGVKRAVDLYILEEGIRES